MRFDDRVIGEEEQRWAVVMPVKRLSQAKSRIAASPASLVEPLAFAFFKDTAIAVLTCPVVDLVIVATSDDRVTAWALAHGCRVVSEADHPGINAAARHGAGLAAGRRTAIVVSDLPCLTPHALAAVLHAGSSHSSAFVTDRQGTGTTIWMAADGALVATRFGLNSRSEHASAGAVDLVAEQPGRDDWLAARHDIDTRDDLVSAMSLGVGAFTQEAATSTPPA